MYICIWRSQFYESFFGFCFAGVLRPGVHGMIEQTLFYGSFLYTYNNFNSCSSKCFLSIFVMFNEKGANHDVDLGTDTKTRARVDEPDANTEHVHPIFAEQQ